MKEQILAFIIQFASCTFLLFAVLLWMQRGNNRSRVYFSIAYVVCSIDLFLSLSGNYNGMPFTFEALRPAALYMALIEIPLFLFYLIEMVNPGWLTWRKIGLLSIPWLLWNACLLIPSLYFRELNTLKDIFRNVGETDVWLRLLFVLLILPYNVFIYCVPYNWRRSSADLNLIRIYGAGFIVMALFFISSSLSGSVIISSLHLAYGTIFCFCTAYYELFVRLQVPEGKMVDKSIVVSVDIPVITLENSTDEPVVNKVSSALWNKLKEQMDTEMPWRSPDFTISDLAVLLQTNRTTLWNEIKANGYRNFHELTACYRVRELCQMIDKGLVKNLDSAFFEVGFRSRTTAYERFKEQTGVTPKEYMSNR